MRNGPNFCKPRRGYHHGSLKQALLQAARLLLGEHGPSGFSLADAAKLAGVTPAAPYRHFTDRAALIDELRQQGFALFTQRLAEAWNEGRPNPLDAMERMGGAYQDFARNEPGFYNAMFGQSSGFLSAASSFDALTLLETAAGAVLRHFGVQAQQTRALALQIWALSHGVATLASAGQLSPAFSAETPEEMVRGGVGALFEAHVRRAAAL